MDLAVLLDHSRPVLVAFVFLAVCMAVTLVLTTRRDT
jgi:hypothetical protein